MKKRLILAAAAVFALSGAGVAQARDSINCSISVGDPFLGAVISNARPVYRYAEPVYVAPPPVVYAPAPRIVYPQPYAVVPYGHGHVYRERWDRPYRDGRGHHGGWDRDRHDRGDSDRWRDRDHDGIPNRWDRRD